MVRRPIKPLIKTAIASCRTISQGHRIVAFLLFAAIPLARVNYMPAFSAPLFLINMVLFGACLVFAVKALRDGAREPAHIRVTISGIDALFLLFYALYYASYLFSRNRALSITELSGEAAFIGAYVLFRVLLGDERRGDDFRTAAAFFITVAAAALSVWGLVQYFFDIDVPIGLKLLFKTHHYPVVASMGNPNFLAEFLVFSVPVAVSYFLAKGRFRLMGALLAAAGLAVYLTYSRLAWFVLALVMIAILAFTKSGARWKVAVAFGLVIALCGSFFIYHYTSGSTRSERIIQTFSIGTATPLFERSVIYRAGFKMLADAGITGMGPGAFGYRYMEYQGKVIAEDKDRFLREHLVDLDHAHCDFIEIGVDAGYPALAAYLLLLAWSAFTGFRRLVRSREDDPLRFTALLPSVFVFFSLWSFPFYIPGSKIFFLLSIAVLSPHSGRLPFGGRDVTERSGMLYNGPRRRLLAAVAALFLFAPFTWINSLHMLSVYHYDRGLRYFKNDFNSAFRHFSRGIQACPYNGYNYFSMGALLLNRKDAAGIGYSENSLQYLNNSTTYLNIARGYRQHGNIGESKKWYRRILRLRPDIRRAWSEYRQIIDAK